MNDAALISDLIEAGVASQLVARVANALVAIAVHGRSTDSADAKLVKDRERKRVERENLRVLKDAAKANDVAASPSAPEPVHGRSTDSADNRCNLLSSLSFFESEESKKEPTEKEKKVRGSVVTRGTRLVPDQAITEGDWSFAIDAGMAPAAAKHAWAEFVDYWIAIPGQRGVKLNWSATWRNRARELIKRGNVNGRNDPKSGIAAADRQLERFGGLEAARSYIPGSAGPTPLRLDFSEMPANPKRISSR